jgi:hypothetical protein
LNQRYPNPKNKGKMVLLESKIPKPQNKGKMVLLESKIPKTPKQGEGRSIPKGPTCAE